MAQVSMTVRMDSQLKKQFNELCNEIGMSVNTAINIFANAVVKTRSIPFRVGAYTPEDETLRKFREFRAQVVNSDTPELTLDEIDEEIKQAREEMAARKKSAI
ncbi:MAG: type II toxin-antitoxin system RelB/DinJ family antitoxin [Bacteroidaceae bacterium]|nr:type II toxin-antitoxin system RelB/DinJ family antitoxin [Bacteroidaceae bacterium]